MKSNKSPLMIVSTGADKKLRRQRILWGTIIFLTFIGVTCLTIKLKQPDTLPIEVVKVEGDYPHIAPSAFYKAVAPYTVGGFFQVNIAKIQQQALTFPWIYQVDVRKVFPHTLEIYLTEQTPVALWNNHALLNPNGDLFQPPSSTFPADLPQITGPEDEATMMLDTFMRMNEMLKPLNLQVIRLDLSMRRAWKVQLSNDLIVFLGRNSTWDRLQRFVDVYPRVFSNPAKKAKSIDMRYPNGFAIQWG